MGCKRFSLLYTFVSSGNSWNVFPWIAVKTFQKFPCHIPQENAFFRGPFLARATKVHSTVIEYPCLFCVTRMHGVQMYRDWLTQMAADLGCLDTAEIRKSSGRHYRQASMDRRRKPQSEDPISFNLDGPEEAMLTADLKVISAS